MHQPTHRTSGIIEVARHVAAAMATDPPGLRRLHAAMVTAIAADHGVLLLPDAAARMAAVLAEDARRALRDDAPAADAAAAHTAALGALAAGMFAG